MRKDLKFTDKILGNKVFMNLGLHIGADSDSPNDPHISGFDFANEMLSWKSAGYDLSVKINTPGGNIMDGWSMIDAIQTCEAETQAVGLAASMGAMCLLFGSSRSARDYATCMIHAPKGGNKAFIEKITSQFKDVLSKTTRFTQDEINDMMTSGKDYFFDASQMLEKGIIDKIEYSTLKIDRPIKSTAKAMYEAYASSLKSEIEENKPTFKIMDFIKALFGGKDENESAKNAMDMKASHDALKIKADVDRAEIEKLKAELITAKSIGQKSEAEKLIDGAIAAGKIDDKSKESWVTMATSNFEGAKAMIEGIKSTPKSILSVAAAIDKSKESGKTGLESKNTYAYMSKYNPKALAKLQATEPEVFAKMAEDYANEGLSEYSQYIDQN